MRNPSRQSFCFACLLLMSLQGCAAEDPPAGPECEAGAARLTVEEIRTILAQAALEAEARGRAATIAVISREGDPLGVFRMSGAVLSSRVDPALPPSPLSGASLPSEFVALSKAGTGAFLSSCGNAFSSRTASFIIQEHFPPEVDFAGPGRLFGVQFSNLPCSDVNGLFLGLAGDQGGIPLYRDGVLVGGIGVETDGIYGIDEQPDLQDAIDLPERLDEEIIALAGARGFQAPEAIRAERIIVDGISFPYLDAEMPPERGPPNFDSLSGSVLPAFPLSTGPPSRLVGASVPGLMTPDVKNACPESIEGQTVDGLFPPEDSLQAGGLSAEEVVQILGQGACRAVTARAAIRRPLGSSVQVNISVVDTTGRILGMFRTQDAPVFGIDVSVQKARSAMFMSRPDTGAMLRQAGLGRYADRLAAEPAVREDGTSVNFALDGGVAITTRGIGAVSNPFFPAGINGTQSGPFSVLHSSLGGNWSPFNTGLQLDLVAPALLQILGGNLARARPPCNDLLPELANGLQIFAGSVPLYKNGVLVGGVGVSGDGIDQDDLVALVASREFEADPSRRSDQILVRGVRIPYVQLPRNPDLEP